jgi:hypothetical protein
MAVNGKIGRLCERIDALAGRRWDNLTEENLTDEGRAKLDRLAASAAPEDSQADARRLHKFAHWPDEAILRFLVDRGVLTPADFRRCGE